MSLSLYSRAVLIILVSFMHVVIISFVFHPFFLKDDYFASKRSVVRKIWGLGWARLDQVKVDLM